MNLEKKFEYFKESINREVEIKRQRLMHQATNDLSIKNSTAIEIAKDKLAKEVESAKRKLNIESNKKIAEATKGAKFNYKKKYDDLKKSLLNEITAELIIFVNSSKYEDYLIDKITRFNDKNIFTKVILSPNDTKYNEQIKTKTGLEVIEGEPSFIGGFILESEKSKLDLTFKTKLEKTEVH